MSKSISPHEVKIPADNKWFTHWRVALILGLLLILLTLSIPFIQNYRLIQRIKNNYGFALTEPGAVLNSLPKFFTKLLELTGSDKTRWYFDDVVGVYINSPTVQNSDLKLLKSIDQLHTLYFISSSITSEGLIALKEISTLEVLVFENVIVTDLELAHFESLKKLRILKLQKKGVSETGLKKLQAALPHCRIEWIQP